MALIVEDGTGLLMADSYVDLETAEAYHASYGNVNWTGDETDKETALRRASRYIDARYRSRLPGSRSLATQRLLWPRRNVLWDDGTAMAYDSLPTALVSAVCEAALLELQTPGTLNPVIVPGEQVQSETVGPLSTTYRSSGNATRDARPVVTLIDDIMAPLLDSDSLSRVAKRA